MQNQHCWRIRFTSVLLGLAIALALAGGECRAGMVSLSNVIEFQALADHMSAVSVSDFYGFDAAALFTYNGAFNEAGWNGTIGGRYQGQPVTGTTSALIIGDPTYNLTGGITVTTPKGKSSDVQFDMTLVPVAGKPNQYTLKNATFGGKTKYKWTGTMTDRVSDGIHNLSGTLTYNQSGLLSQWSVKITVEGTGLQRTILSSFESPPGRGSKVFGGTTWYDTGKVQFAKQPQANNFNGIMSDNVAVAPEPATSSLLGIGAVALLGYTWRRRKPVAFASASS